MAYPKDDTAMGLSVSRSIGDNHFNIDGLQLMIATPDMKKLILEEKESMSVSNVQTVKSEQSAEGTAPAKEEKSSTAVANLPKGDSFILVSRLQFFIDQNCLRSYCIISLEFVFATFDTGVL